MARFFEANETSERGWLKAMTDRRWHHSLEDDARVAVAAMHEQVVIVFQTRVLASLIVGVN